ncbi:MAG: fibronectin type III domain-containing protein [marine benthic group bacterium]|jgi:hypothetical protein|nr:fibronectin type III domain-containing protein [Candidatus Benthicola marisminoris]
MWHDRNNRLSRAVLACSLAIVSATSCAPDGSGDGPPTHPTDRYSVTLEWDAPTTDAVGRPLEDLAGYQLYYTPDPPADAGDSRMVVVGDTTRFTVTGLEAGDYLFAVTALDADGNESEFSEPLPVEVGP